MIPCPTGHYGLKWRWWFKARTERWKRTWPKKRYNLCMQIKLSEWKEVFRESHQDGGRLVVLLPQDQAVRCVQGLGVCPGAVWDDKNLGGIVNTEEDQVIIWKEFRWLYWLGVIDIKWHLIVLSAKSCKVVSMETSNKNFQCEIGAHQLSMTEGRDVDALAAQEIPGSKHWDTAGKGTTDILGYQRKIIWDIQGNVIGSLYRLSYRVSIQELSIACGASPLAFCILLDTLVKKMLNYNSRRATDVVTQTDHLWYKVRLESIICLALARWTNEGTGYIGVFYIQLALYSKWAEKNKLKDSICMRSNCLSWSWINLGGELEESL